MQSRTQPNPQQTLTRERPGTVVRVIHGDTPKHERDQTVEAFQAGTIDVLIGQIVAAGVGLTLTKSSDVLFVETDWTPALVVQAEDRAHRIGTQYPVSVTTLIADGTLDGRIHATLTRNIRVLDELTPDSDHHVTNQAGTQTVKDLLMSLAYDRLTTLEKEAING